MVNCIIYNNLVVLLWWCFEGTWLTASAHIITAVIGSGVLSLAWAIAQMGWVAGPAVLFAFSFITYFTSTLLADCYRSPDPVHGKRNYTYSEVVRAVLGNKNIHHFFFVTHNISHLCLSWVLATVEPSPGDKFNFSWNLSIQRDIYQVFMSRERKRKYHSLKIFMYGVLYVTSITCVVNIPFFSFNLTMNLIFPITHSRV